MDLKRSFEKYLEEEGNKILEVFDKYGLTLRSTMTFKQQNIKATYLMRHKDNLERLSSC